MSWIKNATNEKESKGCPFCGNENVSCFEVEDGCLCYHCEKCNGYWHKNGIGGNKD